MSLSPYVQWLTPGMTRAGDYEKAELGKTEISLVQFSVSYLSTYHTCTHTYIQYTVDPLNKGAIDFVPCREGRPYLGSQIIP